MIDQGKFNLLGVQVNAIDYANTVKHVIEAAQQQQSLAVSALAVHGVMTGVLDPEQAYRLNHLDLVVPDGQPVRWALNWLYACGLRDRVYGPNLMLKVCAQAAHSGLPIFLYGSRTEVLTALADNLIQQFPGLNIVDTQPSYFRRVSEAEQIEIADRINHSGARVVFVGLGCPRQEVWAYEYRNLLQCPILSVGAAFDFHAGLLPQAPLWMQKRGMEWFFRLIQEPQRLWKRYIFLNPYYLVLVLAQKIRLKQFQQTVPIPRKPLRYG